MEALEDKIATALLLGYPQKIGEYITVQLVYHIEEEKELIAKSNFVSPGNTVNDYFTGKEYESPPKIISLMNLTGYKKVLIGLWELSEEENLYRLKAKFESYSDILKIDMRTFNGENRWNKPQYMA